MMNTVNASTGYTPFFLKTGRSPRIIPLLAQAPRARSEGEEEVEDLAEVCSTLEQLVHTVEEVRDNLVEAKT